MRLYGYGGKRGLDYVSDHNGDVMSIITLCSPNNTKRGRCIFICWRQARYPSGTIRTVIAPSGMAIWLKFVKSTMPGRLASMQPSISRKRLQLPIGPKVFIALDFPDNGRIFRLNLYRVKRGERSYRLHILRMSVDIGYGSATRW